MGTFHKYLILLQAVSRMSGRMLLFMSRRFLRNVLAVRFPTAYMARLAAFHQRVPDFTSRGPLSDGARVIVDFYCVEYRALMDAACVGKISLHGRTVDFGSAFDIDWLRPVPEEGDHQMWRVKLAHMGFVCPMLAEGDAMHQAAVASIIKGFNARAGVTAPGAFNAWWFPYAVSHRILAVGAGLLAARARGGLAPQVDAVVAAFLRENAAFLLDNIEHELCNNHVERNVAALSLYFSCVDQVPTEFSRLLERDVGQILRATVLNDGTQAERSPMYQGLCVASLAVMADAPCLSSSLRAELGRKLAAARSAFAALCHPDGEVALFNDSWHAEVPRWEGAAAPDGLTLLPEGGYARLSQGQDVCIFDAGAIGPAWNAGHGHADFLSMEVSLGGQRLIVDPGTSRYNTGAERARERSAQAHNGPVWCGHEPVEFLGCFKVGRLAKAHWLDVDNLPPLTVGGTLSGSLGQTARIVRHYPGEGFLVADLWSNDRHPGQVSWLLPGHLQITLDGRRYVLRDNALTRSAVLEQLSEGEVQRPQPSHCASHYGALQAAWEVRLLPAAADRCQHLLTWIGHHAAPPAAITDAPSLLRQLAVATAAP